MEFRFCHMCGNKIKADAKFCGACGTAVLQLEVEEPAQPEPVVITPDPEPIQPEPEVAVAEPEPVAQEPVSDEPVEEAPVTEEQEAEPEIPEAVPAAVETEPAAVAEEPQPAAEPVMPAEVPAEETITKPKKSPYPKRGAGRTILAILLCFFIFLWSFAAMAIFEIRSATTGKQLTENLTAVMEDSDIANIPASQLVADVQDPDITIVEWAVQEMAANYDGTVSASEKDIETFLEESTFTDFLTDKLSLYLNDVYTGSNDFEITTDEVQSLLEDNADLVEEVFGAPLLEEDIDNFVQELDDRELLDKLEVKTLKEDAAPVYYGVQIGLSYWVIGFFAVMALLFIVLLAKTNKWSMLRTCGDTGITWTVLAAILLLPALVTLIVPDIWSTLLGVPFVDSLIGAVLTGGLIPSAILLGVGIVLIVIKAVGKKIVLKSAKKQV